ncbi:hypothetical protein [Cupriavidus necator]|uniref:hypothetical protein n=1 Tax=Cupriavidus necator TaxID=106590 RepID=UPI00339D67C5
MQRIHIGHSSHTSHSGPRPLRYLLAALIAVAAGPLAAQTQAGAPGGGNYPTPARVEYVLECMAKSDGAYAYLHKCSCAIDQIAARLAYDDYVESSTFAKYATLGGEGGAIFRDPEYGKAAAKRYRSIQSDAQRTCGIGQHAGGAQ